MSAAQNGARNADIDIGSLFAALWREKWRILLGAMVFTLLAGVLIALATPKYEADARLLIESSETVFTRPQGSEQRDNDASLLDQRGVASQVEILTSTNLLLDVAEELDLESRAEFNEARDMSALRSGLVALGLAEDPALVSAERRILENIRDRLEVYAVENSRVIVIKFRSEDRELAALFPNTLAEAYLDFESRQQLENTGRAAQYLESEIAELQDNVREAEAAVADFRSSSDLLSGQNNTVLADQQLSELSTELSRVRASRSEAESRARAVRQALERGASLDSIPDVVDSPLIGRLRERQIALNSEIADLSTTLLPRHPRIQSLQSQLSDLTERIRDEARKILTGLENEAEIARSREEELTRDLNELKAAAASASGRQVELRALEREAASQRALLESYMMRFREARSRDEGDYAPAKARLISRAIVPVEPAFPKTIPLLASAFFVVLVVLMLATMMRELFSGRAFVSEERPVRPSHIAEHDAPVHPAGETTESPAIAPEPAFAPPVEEGEADEPLAETDAEEDFRRFDEPVAETDDAIEDEPSEEEAPDTSPETARFVPLPLASANEPEGEIVAGRAYEQDEDQPAGDEIEADSEQYGVQALAVTLIERGTDRAIVVSPEGDGAAIASVKLARLLSECGLRTVLVDLTGAGAAGKHMLPDTECPGITDLLAARSSYTDIIYPDHDSEVHVIPTGLANAKEAMRAADRLPIILDALVSAYDIVIVECGQADSGGLKRLVREGTQIVLSVVDPAAPEILATADELVERGFEDLVLLSASDSSDDPVSPQPRQARMR